jgi:hypothetical protein
MLKETSNSVRMLKETSNEENDKIQFAGFEDVGAYSNLSNAEKPIRA